MDRSENMEYVATLMLVEIGC